MLRKKGAVARIFRVLEKFERAVLAAQAHAVEMKSGQLILFLRSLHLARVFAARLECMNGQSRHVRQQVVAEEPKVRANVEVDRRVFLAEIPQQCAKVRLAAAAMPVDLALHAVVEIHVDQQSGQKAAADLPRHELPIQLEAERPEARNLVAHGLAE